MLAFLLAGLPTFDLVEKWRIDHTAKDWDRGFTETAILGSRIMFVEETGRDQGAYGALDAATGKRLWSRPFVPETVNYLRVQGYYATISGEHRVRVIEPSSGRAVWQGTHEGDYYDALVANDRLYVERKRNVLTAIDLTNGHILWSTRAPLPFHERTNFGHLTAVGDSLWADDEGGRVTCLRQKDGYPLWSKPFPDGKVFNLLPVPQGVLVSGPSSSEMWDPRDGRPHWRRSPIEGYTNRFYQALKKQIWELPDTGRLIRIDATTGRQLSDVQALPGRRGGAFDSISYRGGAVGYNGHLLIRIDAQGRSVEQYDPQESVYDLRPLGSELLVRSKDGLVLLVPGKTPLPEEPAATVVRLVAKPRLTPEDRRTLLQIGRDALPALLAAIPQAYAERGEVLVELAANIADRRDSERMIDLADEDGAFSNYGVRTRILSDWLMKYADHDALALRLLPRVVSARDEQTQTMLLPYLLQSVAKPVVDALLAHLRSPEASESVKGLIYGGIAASGRSDVLDEILRLRTQGRRLDAPNPHLKINGDHDGDGIPDRLDANPLVSPHPLTEVQRVLFALFDARFRFAKRNDVIGIVTYGKNVAPFELVGWTGGLIPASYTLGLFKEGGYTDPNEPSASISFDSQEATGTPVAFSVNGDEATASIGVHYGPLDGTGYEAKLKKIKGEWFVVSLKMIWIS